MCVYKTKNCRFFGRIDGGIMKKLFLWVGGLLTGVVNGLLGAGGGMIAVPVLKTELEDKKAHATSVAVICSICTVSVCMYLHKGRVNIGDALPYMPFGAIGSLLGTWIFARMKPSLLKKIFACFMLWAGFRMIMR